MTRSSSRWIGHRNDVSALAPLYRGGIVVDTIEIAARWSALPSCTTRASSLLRPSTAPWWRPPTSSHAYIDGACLYFTFAGRMPEGRWTRRIHGAGGSG